MTHRADDPTRRRRQLASSLDEDERKIGSQVEGEITGQIQVNPCETGDTVTGWFS